VFPRGIVGLRNISTLHKGDDDDNINNNNIKAATTGNKFHVFCKIGYIT
jgi:hypothetical protein